MVVVVFFYSILPSFSFFVASRVELKRRKWRERKKTTSDGKKEARNRLEYEGTKTWPKKKIIIIKRKTRPRKWKAAGAMPTKVSASFSVDAAARNSGHHRYFFFFFSFLFFFFFALPRQSQSTSSIARAIQVLRFGVDKLLLGLTGFDWV